MPTRRRRVRGLVRAVATGPRVFLRRPLPGDCDAFLDCVRASRELHRGWVEPANRVEGFRQYVRRARQVSCAGHLACLVEDGSIVGVANVNEIVRGSFQSGYLGYFAFAPFQGRGYMREALGLLIRHVFSELGLHRLEANVQPENARSLALVRALQFRREGFSPRYVKVEGRWRDHERWALTLEDWQRSD